MLTPIIFIVSTLLCSVQGAINEFYPKFLTEERCSGKHAWTMWFNVGKPENENSGDFEDMNLILAQNPKSMCRVPFGIQAQSINYRTGNWSTEWQRKRPNSTLSLLSFRSYEPGGVDFQVRYCCPKDSFVGTTTTTATPMPLDSTTCGRQQITPKRNRMKRLFNGEDVVPHSWPWVVYYLKMMENSSGTNDLACTATLISKDYILTAAHCVEKTNESDISLIAGLHGLPSILRLTKELHKQQWRTVKQIHIHPGYDSETMLNDIALLWVDTPFTFNEYVQPACLPGGEPNPNDEVIIVGWGADTYNGTMSDILRQAYTEVVDHCDTWWTVVDDSKQICVTNAFDGSSSCSGDSGGPLLTQYQGQYVVSGVSSYGAQCNTKGDQSSPDVYTRVTAYKAWIKGITG